MRCLVTGAAGFIGSHLVDRLLGDGHDVIGVDSFDAFYDPALKRANLAAALDHAAFELVEGDLCELDLAPLLEGAGAVFHLAGRPGVQTSWGTGAAAAVRGNIDATRRLLDAARAQPEPPARLVVASSSSVYGRAARFPVREQDPLRPVSPYGQTKVAVERLCARAAADGVAVVPLRYFSVFGPRQRPDMAFARFIAAGRTPSAVTVHGTGRQVRDFTAVRDVVEATLAAARRGAPGRVYNVAGGCPASVLDAVGLIESMLGRRIRVVHGPALPGDPPRTDADTTRARRELGFAPRVALAPGLAEQLAGEPASAAA